MNITWLSALFPAIWGQLIFIIVAGLVLSYVIWSLASALWAAIGKLRIEEQINEHVTLLENVVPTQPNRDVLYAQATHAVGEDFDRSHLDPALTAIDLIPKASLALTVLSLISLIPQIGEGSFNGAFAQKLWITFGGMILLVPAQFLIAFTRWIFSRTLNGVERKLSTRRQNTR
jgi:hypothetical protein